MRTSSLSAYSYIGQSLGVTPLPQDTFPLNFLVLMQSFLTLSMPEGPLSEV